MNFISQFQGCKLCIAKLYSFLIAWAVQLRQYSLCENLHRVELQQKSEYTPLLCSLHQCCGSRHHQTKSFPNGFSVTWLALLVKKPQGLYWTMYGAILKADNWRIFHYKFCRLFLSSWLKYINLESFYDVKIILSPLVGSCVILWPFLLIFWKVQGISQNV